MTPYNKTKNYPNIEEEKEDGGCLFATLLVFAALVVIATIAYVCIF